MPKTPPTPDRLFDRTWRPGHPFRPRVSALRRWAIGLVFFLLCLVIFGYWFFTDAERVRLMAQASLSSLSGGTVTVGRATLSVFQGLRLDDVRLYVYRSDIPDKPLFTAHSLLLEYNPRALLTGQIQATRIVAVDPRVHVVEDAETGRWNCVPLWQRHMSAAGPPGPRGRPIVLPEIVLRNAQVDYAQVRDNKIVESASIDIDGSLAPFPASRVYSFSFQSRSRATGTGPLMKGSIAMDTTQVDAELMNFEFGPDIKAMLPRPVRDFWQKHELAGRLNVPKMTYSPAGGPWRVEIQLKGVTLGVRPDLWLGDDETRRLEGLRRAMDCLRGARLSGDPFVDAVAAMVEPAPLRLNQVHGEFTFTDDRGIEVDNLNGHLEGMPFKVKGRIHGFSPSSSAQLHIASSELDDIEIPAAPRYLNSLPPAVREIYDRFKPRGVCRFSVDLDRPTLGARPRITGQIDIIDGNFTFDKFPYPLRRTAGRIILTQDPRSGEEVLKLQNIRGRGVAGGPNAEREVQVNGVIGPFGPDAGVEVIVSGQQISSEPALLAAFPQLTRKALTIFDAPGKGEFPGFVGDFVCSIIRLRGLESRWIVDTDVRLDEASGAIVGFPYPLRGVTGEVKIRDDYVELVNVNMTKGDASLRIDGRVYWPSGDHAAADQPFVLRPELKVTARNVPVDRDLLEALPANRRAWMQRLGVGGVFDLDGTIRARSTAQDADPAAPEAERDDLDFDLQITMRNGTLWPTEGTFAVSDVSGALRLTNQRLTLQELQGKRGEAQIIAHGEISWLNDLPKLVLRAEARNLRLDSSLYKVLPAPTKAAWDQVRPEGTVDVTLNFSGTVDDATTQPTHAGATGPAGAYEIALTPRELSATPLAVPYRLDQLSGGVSILPDRVIFKDMAARHGQATVRFSGTGSLSPAPVWDFTLAAKDLPVDDDLCRSVPQSLAELLTTMQMRGNVDFEFSKLRVVYPPPAPGQLGDSPTTRSSDSPPDIDFVVRLSTTAAAMDVGVPLENVAGRGEMTGSSRGGKLRELSGRIDVDSLSLAGRSVTNFRAMVVKTPDRDQFTLGKMEAQLAGGRMAGQVDWAVPDATPSRYALNLVLQNADVKELAGETEPDIAGQVSASLALEGVYADPASRRGRGDVSVVGRQMYRVPLILGLLQITNLSLPIASPFTQASVRYSIEGTRVTFEQIEMRSKETLMKGYGHLDFVSRQVKMTFVTDSTAWPKLPLIGDLLQGARHELLQIHVRGTLQEPKVSAHSMNTLTTTVDEVFRGEQKPTTQKK